LANRTRLSKTYWRLQINLKSRKLTVFHNNKKKLSFPVVIGAPDTPTPKGLFAVYEKNKQINSNGFIGPWAIHLTAHSNILRQYDNGPGRIALHGRGGASLNDKLGSAASHGCLRMNNKRIRFIARSIPLGTPVKII
jgi:lipoprotein-anchoring transpeptidase ErfK/SrfK